MGLIRLYLTVSDVGRLKVLILNVGGHLLSVGGHLVLQLSLEPSFLSSLKWRFGPYVGHL